MRNKVIELVNEQAEGDKFIIVDQVMRLWGDEIDFNTRYDNAMMLIRDMVESGILRVRDCESLAYELNN